MKTLGMSKEDMVKRLANQPEVSKAGITASDIGKFVPNRAIENYYRAVFIHSNRKQLMVLIRHVEKNKSKGYHPNQRQKPTVPKLVRRATSQGGGQMFLVFPGFLLQCALRHVSA